MKKLSFNFTLLLILFQVTNFFAQDNYSIEQNVTLNIKNIKSIFYTRKNRFGPQSKTEWTACNIDSSYYKSDTVKLYSNDYFHISAKCCNYIDWTFCNRTTFNLTELFNCVEPPYSDLDPNNYGLKLKLKKNKANKLILSIYDKGKFKDRFILVSLDRIELQKGQLSYRLTMVRKKNILVNESW